MVSLPDVFTSISLAVGIMVGILTVISVFLGFLSVYVTVRVMQITRAIDASIARSSEQRASKSGDKEREAPLSGSNKDKDKDKAFLENKEPVEAEESELDM